MSRDWAEEPAVSRDGEDGDELEDEDYDASPEEKQQKSRKRNPFIDDAAEEDDVRWGAPCLAFRWGSLLR